MIASAFHRVKYSIACFRQGSCRVAALWRGRLVFCDRDLLDLVRLLGLIARGFALGADAREHLPHLPHAHAVGNLELDLVVVYDLGHFAGPR